MFKKILIANRGEIAVRIIRACRDLGISPVGVYSEADREALHVRLCDEVYGIGPASAAKSYLDIEKIIEAARRSGADAIHPGYGFLSENPLFAQACEDSQLVFIGPSAASIKLMGDKIRSRTTVEKAGVPHRSGHRHCASGLSRMPLSRLPNWATHSCSRPVPEVAARECEWYPMGKN